MSVVRLVLILLLLAVPVYAADLHVGSGQTYATVAAGIAASTSGDRVIIHAGTYNEHTLTPKTNTTIIGAKAVGGDYAAEAMPVIDAQLGTTQNTPIFSIAYSNVTIQGLKITGGGDGNNGPITIGEDGLVENITITGNTIYDNNQGCTNVDTNNANCITIAKGTNVTISNNEIYGNCTRGIVMSTQAGASSYVTIKNNYFHNLPMGANLKYSADNCVDVHITWEYNIFRDMDATNSTQAAIGLAIDGSYNLIQHNVFDTGGRGVWFGSNWCGTYNTVRHNTFYGYTNPYYMSGYSNNNTFVDNIRFNATTISGNDAEDNNTVADYTDDPLFTNAAGHDFSLSVGSGAIGAASDDTNYGANISLVGPSTLNAKLTGGICAGCTVRN